ncbi:EpsI family protein [Duganella sp. FT80W]|uniref:EpsI family protein n=2 Tax=Duganella guangzhouensis TaxID=2666084 RepID=A0A6I2L5S9_9BURK|nr:EpsI family protein [Duganella guangzhouensis]
MRKQVLLLVLMLSASGLAEALYPRHKISEQGPKVELETMLPKQFGNWKVLPNSGAQIVNPQTEELIHRIYTQTLSRTYVNPRGEGVMLTVAYGADQSDGLALHYPENCYPAQGFALVSSDKASLNTGYGEIAVKHVFARLGSRSEPVTYWATLGNTVVRGAIQTKLTQLSYGFQGQIPDGLLFRVSSLNESPESGYQLQAQFVQDLMAAVTPHNRLKLAGLQGASGK